MSTTKSTAGLSIEQDSSLIRGKAGTTVQLTVQRKDEAKPLIFMITRETIHAPSVRERVVDNDIGYVQVLVFGLTTGQELASAIEKLDKQGVKGVIFDLRNNGGGYLNAAIDVSSLFIPEGPIVSIDARTKPLTTYDAENIAAPDDFRLRCSSMNYSERLRDNVGRDSRLRRRRAHRNENLWQRGRADDLSAAGRQRH